MLNKPAWTTLIIFCIAVLGWSIYRDIQFEQQYPGDLRNRIVGARLEKDHASPYFYTWKLTDPMRYYDPSNVDLAINPLHVSNITATPFYHHLLAPIADLPQRTISRTWLLIEYLLLAVCAGIAFSLASNRPQKAMVLLTTALFLLTEAWKMHIANGQAYLFIPFLALLFYFFFRNRENLLYAAAAGLCAIVLVLIRPNSIIFFLPFLLPIKKYSVRYIVAFMLPVVMLAGWSLADRQERTMWLDYQKYLVEVVKIHQSCQATVSSPVGRFNYRDWEGWQKDKIDESVAKFPYEPHSENGNVFVLFEKLFHKKTNVAILSITSVVIMVSLLAFFFLNNRTRGEYSLVHIALFGYCLYMISDLFSPMWRHQYYTVQWLFPLLLAASAYKPAQRNLFIFLGFAMLMSILNIPFIKMEHTIGEYCWLGALLYYSLRMPGVNGPLYPQASPGGRLHKSGNNRDHSNR